MKKLSPKPSRRLSGLAAAGLLAAFCVRAGDQPQWGEAWSRNMVSRERGLPDTFDPRTGLNIKWSVPIGTETHSTPIIAGGRVYIGTNNGEPRDPKHHGDRGVVMCFDEDDGHLLWQLVVPKLFEDPFFDWPNTGISSPVTVEGKRVYVVSNRGEVLCLDTRGLANGNEGPFLGEAAHMTPPPGSETAPRPVIGAEIKPQPLKHTPDQKLIAPGELDADIIWSFDMVANAGIWPHDGAHSSILISGNYLYLNTGTGVDNTHKRIRTPDAPGVIVLDKRTGELVARDNEHTAPDVFHATWSAPSLGKVNGRNLLFFAGGNGTVYAFDTISRRVDSADPVHLAKVWQFKFDPAGPADDIHKYSGNKKTSPSNIYGMPVFHKNRLYVAGGGDIFWGKNEAWLKCIDATGTNDITTTGLIWSYPLQKHVMSTPAISDGMVFLSDCGRAMHCVDAETGQPYWTDDIKGEAWASPLVADGKVYLGTRSGDFYVWAAQREKKLLSHIEIGTPVSGTVTAANGSIYLATMNHLFAIAKKAPPAPKTGAERP
ncbi:MAG TPA: PQQ-binding-like beta-propeller repeat protein [Verrucomicrobiae bacterium]|nr:PQQ-binding-like beta-propeller repeat protein [Verrucomicrobiae bacterium]